MADALGDPPNVGDSHADEQLGGGKRLPSPPPIQTPTRLRTTVKPTERATQLLQSAQIRRRNLLAEAAPQSTGEHAPGISSALKDSNNASVVQAPGPAAERIDCASLLFVDVSSQSPFLTCKANPGVAQSSRPTAGSTGSLEGGLKVHHRDSNAGLTGASRPPVSTGSIQVVEGKRTGKGRASSAQPGSLPYIASPRQQIDPLANSLDLRVVLADVKAQKVRERAISASKNQESVGSPATFQDTFQDDDQRFDVTPRARPVPELRMAMEDSFFADEHFAGIDWDQGSARPDSPTPVSRNRREPFMLPTFDGDDPDGDKVTGTVGRTPAKVTDVLEDGFEDIYNAFTGLAGRVGMPFHQVVNRFMRQFAKTCATNLWNSYQSFYAANKEQELARLEKDNPIGGTPKNAITRCYALFQQAYPDRWEQILGKYKDSEALDMGDRTVAQREALFHRLAKHHTQSFAGMAKAHGFEVAFLMAGGSVHQDASLGVVFTTAGAEEFFLERCLFDDNDILAHFKTHIYNNQSLANVAVAREAKTGVRAAKEPASSKDGEVALADDIEIVDGPEMDDHASVRSAFIQALAKLGCEWVSRKLFPWKNLPNKLAGSGVVCCNFPDAVPFPGEDRQRSKTGSKGISELSLAECSILIAALNHPNLKERLRFEQRPNTEVADLRGRRLPVIISAPPEPDSRNAFGKRMFADGTLDYKGPPRKIDRAATRIKKKKKGVPAAAVQEPIVIDDSDDNRTLARGKQKRKGGRAVSPLSISDSGDAPKAAPSAPAKRNLPARKRGRTQPEFQDYKAKSEVDDEVKDGVSSASGSEFVPEKEEKKPENGARSEDEDSIAEGDDESDEKRTVTPSSRKRKRKSNGHGSARVLKKRTFVEVPRVAQAADKGKKKVEPRRKKDIARAPSPASSDDEILMDVTAGVKKVKQPGAPPGASADRVGESVPLDVAPPAGEAPPPAVPVAIPTSDAPLVVPQGRPKPRLVPKDSKKVDLETGADAFSRRKPAEVAEVAGLFSVKAPQSALSMTIGTPANVEISGNSSAGVTTKAVRVDSTEQPARQEQRGDQRGSDAPGLALPVDAAAGAIPSFPARNVSDLRADEMPGVADLGEKRANPAGSEVSGPGERLPLPPPPWYGAGADPRLQGFPGAFYNPFTPWGMFPNVDGNRLPQGSQLPAADVHGRAPTLGGQPFDLAAAAAYFYQNNPYAFNPNVLAQNNMPGNPQAMLRGQDSTGSGDAGNK